MSFLDPDLLALLREHDRYYHALKHIEANCGDDSRPEDNPVLIARAALRTTKGPPPK